MHSKKPTKNTSKKLLFPELKTPLEQRLKKVQNQPLIKNLPHYEIDSDLASNDNDNDEHMGPDGEGERMSELVSTLISKNKVNAKNAFSVPVLDLTGLGFFGKEKEGTGSWSKISATLENSSKVYGFRVDCVSESIARSISIQPNPMQIKQAKASPDPDPSPNPTIPPTIEYNDTDITRHLQQTRSNIDTHPHTLCAKSTGQNSCRIRRMMDQNGVAGLILGSLGIGVQLGVDIWGNGWEIDRREGGREVILVESVVVPYDCVNLSVTKEISKIVQTLNNTGTQINPQYSYFDLEEIGLNEIVDLTQNYDTNYFPQIDLDITGTSQQISVQEFLDDFHQEITWDLRVEAKTRKKQTKKRQQYKKRQTQSPKYGFQSTEFLTRQQVLIKKQSKSETLSNRTVTKQKNLLNTVFTTFSLQQLPQLSIIPQIEIEHNYQETQAKYSLEAITQIAESIRSIAYRNPEDETSRNIRIRQNKQQISHILEQLSSQRIKFSQLHSKHKQFSESCNEALDFLSVLHLGNQMGLTLTEMGCYDFFITK